MAPQARLSEEAEGAPARWFFKGERDRLLYAQRWEPLPRAGRPAPAPVVLVHGFGEHVGRYENLGRALAASGFSLWAFDLAGFGRSDGPRAVVDSLEGAVADIGRMVSAASAAGHKPVLLGHSMGGAFAAVYALDNPGSVRALALSAPALQLAARPKWQTVPAQALASVVPRAGLGRIEPAKLSHDPDVVAQFGADPLVWHGSVPARTAVAMYKAGRLAMKRAGELALPLFVLHGADDDIVPAASSREFVVAAGSRDKQVRVFKGLYHEVFQEVSKQEVVAILMEWLRRHQG